MAGLPVVIESADPSTSEPVTAYSACALGYPDAEFDRTLRKPLGDIVHWDAPGGQRVVST